MTHLSVDAGGRTLATADALGVLKLWDLSATSASVGRMQPSAAGATALLYSAAEQVRP